MNTKKGEVIRDRLETVRYELSLGCTCQGFSYCKDSATYCIRCNEIKQWSNFPL